METNAAMMPGSITISQTQKRYWHGREEYSPGYLLNTRELSEGEKTGGGNKQKRPGQPDMADGCLPAYLL